MAAIFGVVARSPGIDLDAAAAHMQDRLAHRAPDGFTRWKSDGCIFGHGALNIDAPPAQAAQPLRLADGRICVADGFVANFDELRRALGIDAGLVLADVQLMALAIERWGSTFTDHVLGEFAVALWHPRARTLELYCDHLGGRPVCYVQTSQLFAFATSALALQGLPGVEARLDPLGIVTMWYDDANYQKQDYTAFEGVSALAPAHGLHWDETGGTKLRRYWRMSPQAPVRLGDEREYVEAFREVFGAAVARAMRGSGGTALMLSGGIDSAAILAARRGFRQGGVADDLLCVSAVLAPGDHQPWMLAENRNILELTQQHPWKSQFKVPATAEPGSLVTPADLAEVALAWIHPADMSLLVPSLACGLAKQKGCRLILNGVDGDNMTSPGGYHVSQLIREGRWQRAWTESLQAARVNTYLQGQSPAKLFARALFMALEPETIRRMRYRRRTERAIREVDSHPIMAPELAQHANLAQRLRLATDLRFGDEQQRR
jgi:asparagine synthase (glutamine-hydrolysing)